MPTAAEHDRFSLFVATPSLRGTFCKAYVLGIAEVQHHCLSHGHGFELRVAQGISAIDTARNALAGWFLFNSDATHMLFWDDDMGAVADGLVRMFDYRDRDVVAAICPRKRLHMSQVKQAVLNHPEVDPDLLQNVIGDFSGMFQPADVEWATDEPIRLDRIGTGLMMISRACLMRLIESATCPGCPNRRSRADACTSSSAACAPKPGSSARTSTSATSSAPTAGACGAAPGSARCTSGRSR